MTQLGEAGATHKLRIEKALREYGPLDTRTLARILKITRATVSSTATRIPGIESELLRVPTQWKMNPEHAYWRVMRAILTRTTDEQFSMSDISHETGINMDDLRPIFRSLAQYGAMFIDDREHLGRVWRLPAKTAE